MRSTLHVSFLLHATRVADAMKTTLEASRFVALRQVFFDCRKRRVAYRANSDSLVMQTHTDRPTLIRDDMRELTWRSL